MKTQHTPGPWHAIPVGGAKRGSIVKPEEATHWNIYNHHAFVAQVKRSGVREIIEADARLIAAAPDLLAALELMVSAWEARHGAPGMSNSAYMEARAAIARAKGEV
jgi:hypothetical protein